MTTSTCARARDLRMAIAPSHAHSDGMPASVANEQQSPVVSARDSSAPKRDVRFVTVEPGRISLHGVSLTDAEYAMLRGIAERMKYTPRGHCGLMSQTNASVEQGTAVKPDLGKVEAALLKEIKQC